MGFFFDLFSAPQSSGPDHIPVIMPAGAIGTPVEDITQEETKGLVYITDKRVIFVADKNAFDKKLSTLTACVPYSNALKLQFGTKTYTLMVPDGRAMSNTINMINNS